MKLKRQVALSTNAKKLFSSTLDRYELTDMQQEILFSAMQAYDRMNQAADQIAKDGITITGRAGRIIAHPAIAIERAAKEQFHSGIKLIGLSLGDM